MIQKEGENRAAEHRMAGFPLAGVLAPGADDKRNQGDRGPASSSDRSILLFAIAFLLGSSHSGLGRPLASADPSRRSPGTQLRDMQRTALVV